MSDRPQFDHSKAQTLIEQLNSGIRLLNDQTNNRITNAKAMQKHWKGHYAEQFFDTEVPRIKNQAHALTTRIQSIINAVQAAADAASTAQQRWENEQPHPTPAPPGPPPTPPPTPGS